MSQGENGSDGDGANGSGGAQRPPGQTVGADEDRGEGHQGPSGRADGVVGVRVEDQPVKDKGHQRK